MKDELRRAYDVLRHLKKKVGSHAFNEEYGVVISEIREALNMPPEPVKKKKRFSHNPVQKQSNKRNNQMKLEEPMEADINEDENNSDDNNEEQMIVLNKEDNDESKE